MENQVEQTDGSAATLVQRGADAVGIEEGAAAEKEDEGKEKVGRKNEDNRVICFLVGRRKDGFNYV